MVKVMAEAGHNQGKDLKVSQQLVHLAREVHGYHCLCHVEAVTPVVILDWSVVLAYTEHEPVLKGTFSLQLKDEIHFWR